MALRVQRQLALFVAENLHHMQIEETTHNDLLWESYSDAEIQANEQRLVASKDDAQARAGAALDDAGAAADRARRLICLPARTKAAGRFCDGARRRPRNPQ